MGFTYKHLTRLEKVARDKHSSLSRTFVNYTDKKIYNILPRGYKFEQYMQTDVPTSEKAKVRTLLLWAGWRKHGGRTLGS